jgi:hypothetical protein
MSAIPAARLFSDLQRAYWLATRVAQQSVLVDKKQQRFRKDHAPALPVPVWGQALLGRGASKESL